jgi:hypothetical protein
MDSSEKQKIRSVWNGTYLSPLSLEGVPDEAGQAQGWGEGGKLVPMLKKPPLTLTLSPEGRGNSP